MWNLPLLRLTVLTESSHVRPQIPRFGHASPTLAIQTALGQWKFLGHAGAVAFSRTDLWLTIVWVTYLLVFLMTLIKRKEPHIYVANWFFLAFINTIALDRVPR